jgi:Protein of unknown function (DUF3122)
MLRNHVLESYLWIILWVVLTLLLLIAEATLFPQPAIATISQLQEPSGQVLYRSQQRLQDQTGKTWQVILFKEQQPGQTSSLDLRLVGLPGAVEVAHPKSLAIQLPKDRVLMAIDVFGEEAPAPTVGQYNVKELIPELPAEDLLLRIPEAGNRSVGLLVPRSVVQEWQEVAAQG